MSDTPGPPREALRREEHRVEDQPLEKARARLAPPETTERPSPDEPAWFIRNKKPFVVHADHHDDRLARWRAGPAGTREEPIAEDPERFFRPPYVGHRDRLGVRHDVAVD